MSTKCNTFFLPILKLSYYSLKYKQIIISLPVCHKAWGEGYLNSSCNFSFILHTKWEDYIVKLFEHLTMVHVHGVLRSNGPWWFCIFVIEISVARSSLPKTTTYNFNFVMSKSPVKIEMIYHLPVKNVPAILKPEASSYTRGRDTPPVCVNTWPCARLASLGYVSRRSPPTRSRVQCPRWRPQPVRM